MNASIDATVCGRKIHLKINSYPERERYFNGLSCIVIHDEYMFQHPKSRRKKMKNFCPAEDQALCRA
jgi:hypothetical protein